MRIRMRSSDTPLISIIHLSRVRMNRLKISPEKKLARASMRAMAGALLLIIELGGLYGALMTILSVLVARTARSMPYTLRPV